MPRTDIVAIIPAYQAEGSLEAVVQGVRRHLVRCVVVDDGSTDESAERAAAAGAEVLRLAGNRGKGSALREGFAAVLADEPSAVVLLDADGQHDPDDLPRFLALWDREAPDLIVGARLATRDGIPGARYWTNYIGSRILSRMTGWELEDSQSGYRLLSARLAAGLHLESDGYAIESEMLLKAARIGARMEHVPVRTIYNQNGSHFRPVLDTFRISCAAIYFKIFDDGA